MRSSRACWRRARGASRRSPRAAPRLRACASSSRSRTARSMPQPRRDAMRAPARRTARGLTPETREVTRALNADFYARPVLEVARDLIGCTVAHESTAGVIVETEAYHDSEPACHAFVGLTPRTRTLFGPPGVAYLYRSYGIHAMLNAVCEPEGVGAAVLIRALEPVDGVALMRERRGTEPLASLCSGP